MRAESRERKPVVWIEGINALGPLHQGREILMRVLKNGGALRVLLLDPRCLAFRKRSDDEHDYVGRLNAELFAAFFILMDILRQFGPKADDFRGNLEVKLHQQYPDRSLIILNGEDKNNDEIILANPYLKPEDAEPLKPEEARGTMGPMFPLVCRGRTETQYKENIAHYKKLWDAAKTVDLWRRPSGL